MATPDQILAAAIDGIIDDPDNKRDADAPKPIRRGDSIEIGGHTITGEGGLEALVYYPIRELLGAAGASAGGHIPLSGAGVGDNTGWSVIGRARFNDADLGSPDSFALVVECEASAEGVPGEIALYGIEAGESYQVGGNVAVTSAAPTEVLIAIAASSTPTVDRIFEVRARVNGGDIADRCIVWASYIVSVEA